MWIKTQRGQLVNLDHIIRIYIASGLLAEYGDDENAIFLFAGKEEVSKLILTSIGLEITKGTKFASIDGIIQSM